MKTLSMIPTEINIQLHLEKGTYYENTPMHASNFHELLIVMDGDAISAIEGTLLPVEKGYIMAIPQGFRQGLIGVRNLRYYRFVFNLDAIVQTRPSLKHLIGFQSFFLPGAYFRYHHIFNSILIVSDSRLELIKQLCELIHRAFQDQSPGYNTSTWEYFTCLLTILSNEWVQMEKPAAQNFHHLEEALAYLETHYFEPLSIKDLAEIAHLSERHFSRMFKQTYGSTPNAYLIRCRVNHASDMLVNSSSPLAQISEDCGFPNIPSFTKIFKSRTGVTPSQYRKGRNNH